MDEYFEYFVLFVIMIIGILLFSVPFLVIWRQKAIQKKDGQQMFCKHCGARIKEGIQFCPMCGQDTGIPASKMMSKARARQKANKKICQRCGSENLKIETVVESRSAGCFSLIFSLIFLGILTLFIPVIGAIAVPIIIVLILVFIFKKRSVTITYATCQNCGFRQRMY